jgi:hypothetical protein
MRSILSPSSSAATAINAFFSVCRLRTPLLETTQIRLVDFDGARLDRARHLRSLVTLNTPRVW